MRFRHFLLAFVLLVFLSAVRSSDKVSAYSSSLSPTSESSSTTRFAGPFENNHWGYGGTVIIDMDVGTTTVSGYIDFTNDPDVGALCGAGSFNGTRSGDNFQFQFVSYDSDPGCSILGVDGTVFDVSGSLSNGQIVNGRYTHPSTGQSGTFSADQTTHYVGDFVTNGYPGSVVIDVATNGNGTVTGYMDFTNDPGVGALCGSGAFRGTINDSGGMSYDFLSNDPDAGCGFDYGWEFAVSASLNGFAIENGRYTVVNTGQSGTFSTACVTLTSSKVGLGQSDSIFGDSVDNVCPTDTTPPTGKIIWPYDNTNLTPGHCTSQEKKDFPDACKTYGPGDTVRIEAIASDDLAGVHRVGFGVIYNGLPRGIKTEYFHPYEADFTIPMGLRSQSIQLFVTIVDKAGNTNYAVGGMRDVDYQESYDNPDVVENWIPDGNRSYLNQISLSTVHVYDENAGLGKDFSGEWQCGGASVAMVLRMQEQIGGWYASLSSTAQDAFVASTSYYRAGGYWSINYVLSLISFMEDAYSIEAAWLWPSQPDGWRTIKQEIDQGNPVVVLTDRNGTNGHYFVVVGYREAGSKQTLIVYDPYGKWLGPGGTFNYDKNSTDQNSRKGQWAYYDYDQIWGYGNSTYTGRIMTVHQIGQLYNGYTVSSDARGPADAISVEPENLVTYSGMKIMEGDRVYLPLVITDGAD